MLAIASVMISRVNCHDDLVKRIVISGQSLARFSHPWVSIDGFDDVDLTVSRPLVTIARPQHPDGGPGALTHQHQRQSVRGMKKITYLEVTSINLSRES